MGTCNLCGNKAGFLRTRHGECTAAHSAGLAEMTRLARDAASESILSADELHSNLNAIASRSFATDEHIGASIAQGWKQAVEKTLSAGTPTREQESRLRRFYEQLVMPTDSDVAGVLAKLNQASIDRILVSARRAALAVTDGESSLHELARLLDDSELSPAEERHLLARAWEEAVNDALEDGVLSLDEESALSGYLGHFNLSAAEVNSSEGHEKMLKAVAIRQVAEGVIPQSLDWGGNVPFNLMKSEQLVWVFDYVDYLEVVTRRQRRGTSHGVSVRVAKGLYYSPRTFSSQTHEWDETVHVDTGLLGVTTKYIYFHGPRKRFRVRYDRIVSFDPYTDGIGIMRDSLSAKPQSFRTGDGWFVYNLVTNLSQW